MYNPSAYSAAMQNPVITTNPSYINPNNQNVTKFTVEQQQYMQQQQNLQQSSPYDEGCSILSKCSQVVREKIQSDSRYLQSDREFEILVQEYLYNQIIPNLLQHQEGRIAAEKWCNTIKLLATEYNQEEIEASKNMQVLMSDPIVLNRLKELQQENQKQTKKTSIKKQHIPNEIGDVEE